MNPFKSVSIRVTFFFSFLLFSLLIIAALGVTSYLIVNQEVVKQTIETRTLLLDELNKQLLAENRAVENDSLVIASNPRLLNYLQRNNDSFEQTQLYYDVIDLLRRLTFVKESIHSVQLYAPGMSMKTDSDTGVFDYALLERYAWYGQIEQSDYAWIGAYPLEGRSRSSGDATVISFARKVYSSQGRELGILLINLHVSSVQRVVHDRGDDASRMVLDASRRVITVVSPTEEARTAYAEALPEIGAALDEATTSHAITEIRGKELLIWSSQPNTSWVMLDIIPWSAVTAGSERIERVIVLAAAICVLASVGMAFLLSDPFVKPIRRLMQTMNQVRHGKLDVRIHSDYRNEFGRLNAHFNHMIARLNDLLAEIHDRHKKQREAELRVLQEQINPHFLYNTLDMINWHAIENGDRNVSRMLSLLGKMLRIGLARGASFLSVRDEMEHLSCYVELQKVRHLNRIAMEVSYPETLGRCMVPKLLVQPFVENALLYAFPGNAPGQVRVRVDEEEGDLVFTVADNGRGMELPAAARARSRGGGGIRNVEERIRLYFGAKYGLTIDSGSNRGTTVRIRIPKVAPEQLEGGVQLAESGSRG